MITARKGFTLIELAVVGSCLTLVISGAYGFLLVARSQQRTGEVDLRLARQGSLVEEAWRRDARAAKAATPVAPPGIAVFDAAPSPIAWRVEAGCLIRRDGVGDAVLSGDVASAVASKEHGLLVLDLTLAANVGDVERRDVHHIVAAAPEALR